MRKRTVLLRVTRGLNAHMKMALAKVDTYRANRTAPCFGKSLFAIDGGIPFAPSLRASHVLESVHLAAQKESSFSSEVRRVFWVASSVHVRIAAGIGIFSSSQYSANL